MSMSLPAIEAELVAIDFESTGSVAEYANEPWQIGLLFIAAGKPSAEVAFTSLLRVGERPFNPYAPGRHAALREDLAQAPSLLDLWPTLNRWLLGRPLVAHNAATEKKMLEEAFPLHQFGPWIDTLELARMAYPRAATHKLEDLIDLLGLYEDVATLCPGRAPHDALFDAAACAVLLAHILALPHWHGVTMDDVIQARSSKRWIS